MKPIFALFMVLTLCGCGTTTSYYLGAKAAPENVIQLPAGDVSNQTWQDLYLKVNYGLQHQGDQLTITGKLSYADYTKMNLAAMDKLSLSLYLLDNQGRVSKYLLLANPLSYHLNNVFAFRKQITVPPTVTAMAFGYDGQFLTEEGALRYIWNMPKRAS